MPRSSASQLQFAMYRRRGAAGWRSQVEQTIVEAGQPSRNRPQGQVILVVLLFALPLMALLVREQSRVIDTQRVLIQQLAIDSSQLNSIRMRELQNRPKPAAPSANAPSANAPSTDTQKPPSTTPEHKPRKRHESKQEPTPTPGPQEYPANRAVPVRKSI
jgi:outer membrane biosynthesis protein TonB